MSGGRGSEIKTKQKKMEGWLEGRQKKRKARKNEKKTDFIATSVVIFIMKNEKWKMIAPKSVKIQMTVPLVLSTCLYVLKGVNGVTFCAPGSKLRTIDFKLIRIKLARVIILYPASKGLQWVSMFTNLGAHPGVYLRVKCNSNITVKIELFII